MGIPLVTATASACCAHGGRVTAMGQSRVRVAGAPVVTVLDAGVVSGCPFRAGGAPDPCLSVRWTGHTTRVRIGGQPAVLQTGAGLSLSARQIPAGPVTIAADQIRVTAI
jgi:hypothetical protein